MLFKNESPTERKAEGRASGKNDLSINFHVLNFVFKCRKEASGHVSKAY